MYENGTEAQASPRRPAIGDDGRRQVTRHVLALKIGLGFRVETQADTDPRPLLVGQSVTATSEDVVRVVPPGMPVQRPASIPTVSVTVAKLAGPVTRKITRGAAKGRMTERMSPVQEYVAPGG
jgi:hypothetical protein